ncbi:MAG: O-antigen ligase family protein [Candidatus Absconditabacteria bacterium]
MYNKIGLTGFFLFLFFLNFWIILSGLANGFIYINWTLLFLSATVFVNSQFWKVSEHRNNILYLMLLSSLVFLGFLTISIFPSLLVFSGERITVFNYDLNLLGYTLVYIFVLVLYYVIKRNKYYLLLINLYILLLVFVTGSRSALIILAFVSFVAIFLYLGKKRIGYAILVLSVFVFVFFLLIRLPVFETLYSRFLALIGLGNNGDLSANFRFLYVQQGIELISNRMTFGYGGDFQFPKFSFDGHFSHNNIIEIAFNYGLTFLLVYECMILVMLFRLFFTDSRDKSLYISFIVVFLLVQFFYPNFTLKTDMMILGLVFSYLPERKVKINYLEQGNSVGKLVEKQDSASEVT